MLLKIYCNNPNPNHIDEVVSVIKKGGIAIIPTDTLYAYACDMNNKNAVKKIILLKNKNIRKANLSVLCYNLSQASMYAKINDTVFRLMKDNLPGAFTFILNGNNQLPKLFKNKKQIGIRIPDNNIAIELAQKLGNPLMVSTVNDKQLPIEEFTHPELIYEAIGKNADIMIEGDISESAPSTIVDCTDTEIQILRQGVGKLLT